ncbi:hypothetical protein Cni_G14609 [Canna indica]|uniref:Uncharacterized protein n=1 Tax=Canna indica TaxID=4628 RepID=A0AAQ3QE52_9LILI|nr:hypothetical protein Cni_G14609 [Canna indica]
MAVMSVECSTSMKLRDNKEASIFFKSQSKQQSHKQKDEGDAQHMCFALVSSLVCDPFSLQLSSATVSSTSSSLSTASPLRDFFFNAKATAATCSTVTTVKVTPFRPPPTLPPLPGIAVFDPVLTPNRRSPEPLSLLRRR